MPVRVLCCKCSTEIAPDDVNVGEGVAYCRKCGTLTQLADLVANAEDNLDSVDRGPPPRGCVVRDEGTQIIVRASAHSLVGAAGTLFATVFWNGIVSVFVLGAASGTIFHLFGSVPSWFPVPSINGGSGSGMSLGMVIFLWIFLIPFIAAGAMLAGATLTLLFGRVEVRLRGPVGMVFMGFGPVG